MRAGDWIQTYTGRQFWPLDPRPDEIDIVDVGHALSMQCRYAGHCRRFYSVAEHCWHVSWAVPPELALWGLLHDAAEAYLVDLPQPVKGSMPIYRAIESRVMAAVCARFGLDPAEPPAVKRADCAILLDEQAQLMAPPPAPWADLGVPPLGIRLWGWPPQEAERRFLGRFGALTIVSEAPP